MPIDLENIPEEEFIRLCEELESKTDIGEKMGFYVSVTGKYRFGDISFISREIDGIDYRFGISFTGRIEYKKLEDWAFANLVQIHFDMLFNDNKLRKQKCEEHELREFMDRELSRAKSKTAWIPQQRGFDAELSKQIPIVSDEFDLEMDLSIQIDSLCFGMARARFYSALNKEMLGMNHIDKEVSNDFNEGLIGKYKISKKYVSKADILRILYAINSLRFIANKEDDSVPTKKQFFADFGSFLGVDLSNWSESINQFKIAKDPTNRKVFDDMAKVILDYANGDSE